MRGSSLLGARPSQAGRKCVTVVIVGPWRRQSVRGSSLLGAKEILEKAGFKTSSKIGLGLGRGVVFGFWDSSVFYWSGVSARQGRHFGDVVFLWGYLAKFNFHPPSQLKRSKIKFRRKHVFQK